MIKNHHSSLWRWICARILALAIGSVIVIATCMWLRYAVQNYWIMGRMPAAVRQEFLTLSQNPQANPARFHNIVDTWWGLSYSTPSIASADWVTVALLVLVMIPFIVVMGLKHARPLALQFSRLRDAAKDVANGQFGRQAELIKDAPAEMVSFATDFNTMTRQLARYEKELRASHVAMAHELRSPLTAAIGRLQGMLDGVFDASPEQLGMVMKQLQHLNRLTDELHLLSLADAGNLVLEDQPFCLDELIEERAAWMTPQADAHNFTITLRNPRACPFSGDAFRMGQVFTILMENALRYGHDGGHLAVTIHYAKGRYTLEFKDDGPGVSPQFLPEMFKRFSREEQSRARHSGGSGLGLSIAQAICQAHGGSISASLADTGGLVVRILLPWRPADEENSHS
ncbi:Signal transduction histidine-protein kinase BaeS [Klebsiella electrica]|uniref:sensor histidine kinase n=1 Tax=Klebsiella electrica TaxID=1259973 RepID=UPI00114E9C05|nr:ATP-binding protein [Klebsiella electrica]QDI08910.1 Signal transduction histidine-protein kinase BaeS [Klebsiella electrica]WIO45195.1 ATP-binding protein [Klebsiella electrica]